MFKSWPAIGAVLLAFALAILPTKGLTLPFVSFGGSSLIMNALAAGILLNISRQAGDATEVTPPPAGAVAVTDPPSAQALAAESP